MRSQIEAPEARLTAARALGLLLGLALLAGCGSPAGPTPTSMPTSAPPAVPAASPSPSPLAAVPVAVVSPASGASAVLDLPTLGGTRAGWVRAKGAPSRGARGEVFDQDIAVTFSALPDGIERATRIELQLGHETGLARGGVPLAEARDLARPLHPPDARAVRSYPAEANQAVEVFQSSLLAAAFQGAPSPAPGGGSPFGDAPPGTYLQIAERGGPTTNRVDLVVGDRP